jgi:hypothetical protein
MEERLRYREDRQDDDQRHETPDDWSKSTIHTAHQAYRKPIARIGIPFWNKPLARWFQ